MTTNQPRQGRAQSITKLGTRPGLLPQAGGITLLVLTQDQVSDSRVGPICSATPLLLRHDQSYANGCATMEYQPVEYVSKPGAFACPMHIALPRNSST